MKGKYNVLLKASISALVGIAGLTYLKLAPVEVSKYNPHIMKTPAYTLVDADRDGDVDVIEPKDYRKLVAPDMVAYLKDRGDTFIDFMYRPFPIPPELQESANKTLYGKQNPEQLETQLIKFYKR